MIGRSAPFKDGLVLGLGIALAASLAGCGLSDAYPLMDGPGASQRSPAAVGEAIPAVVLYVEARPGDSIELISAEALGTLDGATVDLGVSRPILSSSGDHVTGDRIEPLPGAVISSDGTADVSGVAVGSVIPGEPVGIVAFLRAQRPGRYTIDRIRLRYRLNGGSERVGEGLDTIFTVCALDPKPVNPVPSDCPDLEEEPEG